MKPTLDNILDEVTNAFEVNKEDFYARIDTRERLVVEIKQVVCYLGQKFGYSQSVIGKFLGIDHSSVCYNKKTAQDICDTDGEYASRVNKAWNALDEIVKKQKEYTINGWVTRDKHDNSLVFYIKRKPERIDDVWLAFGECYPIPKEACPNITWDNSPRECEITLKIK